MPCQKRVQTRLLPSAEVSGSSKTSTVFLSAQISAVLTFYMTEQKNITGFATEKDGLAAHLRMEVLHQEVHQPDVSDNQWARYKADY